MSVLDLVPAKIKKVKFSLRSLLLLRLFFGLYFKLCSSRIICCVARLYCVISFMYHIWTYIYVLNILSTTNTAIAYKSIVLFNVIANGLVSFVTGEEAIIDFSKNTHYALVCTYSRAVSSYVVYIIVLLALSARYVTVVCSPLSSIALTEYILSDYAYMCYYFSQFTSIYVTDRYRKNMYFLRTLLNDSLKNKNLTDEQKTINIKHFTLTYIKLAKTFASVRNLLRLRVILGLTFTLFNTVSEVSFEIVTGGWISQDVPFNVNCITCVVVMCIPLILMELAANDVDEMKNMLANELLTYEDKKLRHTVHDALEYIDASIVKHAMWNLFPMNVTTLLGFLSVSISYVIVIFQFIY